MGPQAWVALALTVLAAGCGVLTIDVDVYKGPLVNDDSVQMEQVAVIAIGAKPLLIQLRDRLEGKQRYPELNAVEGAARFRQEEGQYQDDVIDGGRSVLKSPSALEVNNVLSLYNDSGGSRLGVYMGEMARAGIEYEAAYRAFSPGAQEDRRFLDSVTPAFATAVRGNPPAKVDRTQCLDAPGGKPLTVDEMLRVLRNDYEQFLAPAGPERQPARREAGGRDIVRIHRCLLKSGPAVLSALGQAWPEARVSLPDPTVLDPTTGAQVMSSMNPTALDLMLLSPDAAYALLRTPELIGIHSLLLFGPNAPAVGAAQAEREQLVERMRATLEGWARARAAMERQWRAALDALALLATSRTSTPKEVILIRLLAYEVARRVEPHLLVAALVSQQQPPALAPLATTIRPLTSPTIAAQTRAQQDQILRELELFIQRDPAGAASGLTLADRLVRDPSFVPRSFAGGVDARFASSLARAHGLLASLKPDAGLPSIAEMRELVASLSSASGFEAGRLASGLQTLIRTYREAAHRGDVGATKRQLLDELVGFAQKVLFVTNFSMLVDSEEIRQEGHLLQAVGNVILTQVDELKQVDTAGRRAARRARMDESIRRSIWEGKQDRTKAGQTPIDCDAQGLARVESDGDAPKRVLDCVITELRYLHLHALKSGDVNAKNLEAALQAALEQRSRLVQIRPAAAFLRNSYPVTSLQRRSSASWSNMLEGHAGRQFNYTGDDAAGQRAFQEFDKQFWQNVNTVRVAGAGVTNYVIAKDDVGNWYVKNFSSDPEQIIKSAKSLALFAAGGSLSADAVNRASQKISDPKAAVADAPVGDSGATQVLRDQRDAADRRNVTATQSLLADIKDARSADGLASRIDTQWKGTPKPLPDAARRELLAVAVDQSRTTCGAAAGTPASPDVVVAELRRVNACRDAILTNLEPNLLRTEIQDRVSKVNAEGTKADAKVSPVPAGLPVREVGDAKKETDKGVKALDNASSSLKTVADASTAFAAAQGAAQGAQTSLATAESAVNAVRAATNTGLGKAQAAVAALTDAAGLAAGAQAAAATTRVMRVLASEAVAAVGKAKTGAESLVTRLTGLDALLTAAENTVKQAKGDVAAVVAAYSGSTAAPTAAALTGEAQKSVAQAARDVGALLDATGTADKEMTAAKDLADAAVRAVKRISTGPQPITDAEAQDAQAGVKAALNSLVNDYSRRRDDILRDHVARLKAILGEE
jgi:hypothetical protein